MLLFWNMCCAFQWNMRFDCFQITLSNVLFFDAQSLITLKSGGLSQLDSLWLYYLDVVHLDKISYFNVFVCLQKQSICTYSFWRLHCKFQHFIKLCFTVVPRFHNDCRPIGRFCIKPLDTIFPTKISEFTKLKCDDIFLFLCCFSETAEHGVGWTRVALQVWGRVTAQCLLWSSAYLLICM